MIINGIEYPDDPEEGRDVQYISIRTISSVYIRPRDGYEQLLGQIIFTYDLEEPSPLLWYGVQRAFSDRN